MSGPKTISLAEFNSIHNQYPTLLKEYAQKNSREGATPLEELDRFRYIEAPQKFKQSKSTMTIGDIEKLVEWKLNHGRYRPGFLKKVKTNTNETVQAATEDAFKQYSRDPSDIGEVIDKLKEPLKGIGPATASLILAVHDPDHVIFFSDEVFKWLVNDGEITPNPKYTVNEFEKVHAAAKDLIKRLHVTPLQIERVAFVIIREREPVLVAREKTISDRGRGRPRKLDSEKKAKVPSGKPRGRPAGPAKPETARIPRVPKVPAAKVAKAPAKAAAAKSPGKKRGRPAKDVAPDAEDASTPASKKRKASDDDGDATPASKKKKGDAVTPASAGRGRPKKVKA